MLRLKKPDGIAIKSALVAVSGNSADEDAVRFAAQLTEPLRGNLYIVHVIEVERSLPVDSELPFHTTRGDDLLDRMERTARPFKCEVYSELLQARLAGHAIVHEAAEREVDAVVIGMPYKTKYGQIRAGRRCAVCARTRALSCRSVAGCGTGRNESRLDGIKTTRV